MLVTRTGLSYFIRPSLLTKAVRPGGARSTSMLLRRGREWVLWGLHWLLFPSLPMSSFTVLPFWTLSLLSLYLVPCTPHGVLWRLVNWGCAPVWVFWCSCALHWPEAVLCRRASCSLSPAPIRTIPRWRCLGSTGFQLRQWVFWGWRTLPGSNWLKDCPTSVARAVGNRDEQCGAYSVSSSCPSPYSSSHTHVPNDHSLSLPSLPSHVLLVKYPVMALFSFQEEQKYILKPFGPRSTPIYWPSNHLAIVLDHHFYLCKLPQESACAQGQSSSRWSDLVP